MQPAALLRKARREAGITQAELARRLGVSQTAVAKLERPGANPTVRTLNRALQAAGRHLSLGASQWPPGVDESLIRQQLELTPAQRVRQIEEMYREGQRLLRAGRISRGEQ